MKLETRFSYVSRSKKLTVTTKDPSAWDFSQDLGISPLAFGSWEVAPKKVKILEFQVKSRIRNNFYCYFKHQKSARSTNKFMTVIWKEIDSDLIYKAQFSVCFNSFETATGTSIKFATNDYHPVVSVIRILVTS